MAWEFDTPTYNQGGTYPLASSTTGLAALDSAAVRQLWETGLLVAEETEDFFQKLEGASTRSVIRTKTDTSKGRGQKITFTNGSGFYHEPHMGDAMFETNDEFENMLIGTFNLEVDWFRHATRFNERMEEVMGMRGEIASGFNVRLGQWLGRLKSEQLFALFQLKLSSNNVLYAGGKSLETLKSADTLAWDEIVRMGEFLKPLGGIPANISKAGSRDPVWANVVVPTTPALFSLKMDSDYKTILADAGSRGSSNHLFGGGYPNVDGHIIYPYNPIDHDGRGAVGSFLNPKAYLGVAITAGTTAITVSGGGSENSAASLTGSGYQYPKFFKYFPGYAYLFPTETIDPAAGTNYFLIYNSSGSDAGKFGMYSYANDGDANNGNAITITSRLGSAESGARVTTLGGVTWNTGVWAGKHTDAHPSGSLIIPCNSYGVPIGDTLMLMSAAAHRGYGKYRGHRSQQEHEGGFVTDRFITSVFGQVITEDRLSRHTGVARLRHAVTYPGISFPTVV